MGYTSSPFFSKTLLLSLYFVLLVQNPHPRAASTPATINPCAFFLLGSIACKLINLWIFSLLFVTSDSGGLIYGGLEGGEWELRQWGLVEQQRYGNQDNLSLALGKRQAVVSEEEIQERERRKKELKQQGIVEDRLQLLVNITGAFRPHKLTALVGAFVEEVMELVELTPLSGALVGLPGVDGLSTDQRKRLTIAVELVANPPIVFLANLGSALLFCVYFC
ncbi:hypothetical protein Vadar_004440 [Vaccinium darrowii]|uniref:Uncharacterized protein n=1 Tax=Vaccinium darrowii TaxID=229202 RepID=A0ACB7XN44_9ERIC|nr:hypothetical protein Vadar_004440 [Vaccinium darrowii]